VGKWLLFPASWLYGLITDFRNWLYDKKLMDVMTPSVYTICVGNLTVGGTGKTPMVEFLIKRYQTTPARTDMAKPTATLSRGYGRKTTGFRIATDSDTATTIGDEPLQLYRRFSQLARICVGERRANAIQRILHQYPETIRILLDDGFQHRPVQAHLNILLMDYNRPFYDDYPFPVGRLRERRHGARRADVVVVTKCPNDLWATEQQRITSHIQPYIQSDTPVFFAGLQYGHPVSFADQKPVTNLQKVMLVSGLANAAPLEQYVRRQFQLHYHERFPDHYDYSRADLDRLLSNLPSSTSLLTTEKDWVKLDALLTDQERATLPLYYLSIAVQFLPGNKLDFTTFLDNHALKNS
jgi:tetraacyldisaccharide 4'-kinase